MHFSTCPVTLTTSSIDGISIRFRRKQQKQKRHARKANLQRIDTPIYKSKQQANTHPLFVSTPWPEQVLQPLKHGPF